MHRQCLKLSLKLSRGLHRPSSNSSVNKAIFDKVEKVLSKGEPEILIQECIISLPTVTINWDQDVDSIRYCLAMEEDSLHSIQNSCILNFKEQKSQEIQDEKKIFQIVDHLKVKS